MFKEEWVKTSYLLDITKISASTLNTYLNNIFLGKYRRVNRFFICQESLNTLYSYLLKKGITSKTVWQAAKRIKKYYPNVEEIELIFPN